MRIASMSRARWSMRAAAAGAVAALTVATGTAYATLEPGVDTSHYQHSGTLNWSAVATSGVKFAFLKATEGTTFTDPTFASDWAATAQAGIFHGAYHFARPGGSGTAVAQAKYFVSRLPAQNVRGTLPPVLDLEATGGLSHASLITWTRTWLEEVTALTGRTPIIYVSPAFWRDNLSNSTAFHAYPLWIANYGVSSPSIPGGWPTYSFWQTTSSGRITGISGNVDKDVFNGSMTQLEKFALAYQSSATAATLTATPSAPMVGQDVVLAGSLTSGGSGISSRNLSLQFQPAGSSTWASVATVRTSGSGSFSTTVPATAAGRYRAYFSGGAVYKTSTSAPASVSLTPTPTTVTMSPSATSAKAGATVTFAGDLRVDVGAPSADATLSGRPVTLAVQATGTTTWKTVGRATTTDAGRYSVPLDVVTAGSYRASFPGEQAYAGANSGAHAVAVLRNTTTVTMRPARTATYAGAALRFAGTLATPAGPVADQPVELQRRQSGTPTWTTVANARTSATGGYASIQKPNTAATYRTVFPATPVYAGSSSSSVAISIVPPEKTKLTLTDLIGPRVEARGTPVVLKGHLVTSAGVGVGNHPFHLYKHVVGTHGWSPVGTVVTTAQGTWRTVVKPNRTISYRAVFLGNTRFARAAASSVTVHVG